MGQPALLVRKNRRGGGLSRSSVRPPFARVSAARALPNWLNHLDEHVLPWLADHRVEDAVVYPAAAIVESALAAARHRSPEATVLEAAEIELRRPLTFDSGTMRELRMMLTSEDGDWQLVGRP